MSWGAYFKKAFLIKPIDVALVEGLVEVSKLDRSLSLFDLICIGVGGTVGSGIFVLTGLIASEYAGPGVVFSWLLGGFACSTSALSYAELSCLIPVAGSAYSYIYLGLGELPAFLGAWCLTLEYGISGAAVASSWGIKIQNLVSNWMHTTSQQNGGITVAGVDINIYGGLLQFAVVLFLLRGIYMNKMIINFFTVTKLLLIAFIIIAGMLLFKSTNISNWTPYGVKGVLRGAASSFFGYLGYDEVCCMAGEAKNPQRNLPRAVIGTIAIVTTFYVLAALALVGMVPYSRIDPNSGFSQAFGRNDWAWAQQLVAIGEVFTLPLVVLVSFLAQPRVQYALSVDGLLPVIFQQMDNNGNLVKGIWWSGILCTLVAIFIPLSYLDDIISAGVLISFNLTNTSLIIMRYKRTSAFTSIASSKDSTTNLSDEFASYHSVQSTISVEPGDGVELLHRQRVIHITSEPQPPSTEHPSNAREFVHSGLRALHIHLLTFHTVTIVLAVAMAALNTASKGYALLYSTIACTSIGILFVQAIWMRAILYPKSVLARLIHLNQPMDGSYEEMSTDQDNDRRVYPHQLEEAVFQVPFMPFVPLTGLVINYYLIAQLSWFGLLTGGLMFAVVVGVYFGYSVHNSVGNNGLWKHSKTSDTSSNAIRDEYGDDIVSNAIHNAFEIADSDMEVCFRDDDDE